MKVYAEQFRKHLSDKTLAIAYWFTGDEPLQLQECREALLKRAKQLGFAEHQRLDLQTMDGAQLNAELYATSLFSEKRVIEIALTQGKLNETLTQALLKFCDKPNLDVVLLIQSPKLEAGVAQGKAYKAFETAAMVVQVWPLTADQLPKWFAARLAQHQLSTSLMGLKLLTELTEGNLLYAAQSVEKLALLYPQAQTVLTPEQILQAVAPQTHFDVFQLNEAFLLGDKIRAIKICRNLRASGEEIILVWGALLRDIRLLLKLAAPAAQKNFAESCQQLGIWDKRRPMYRAALQRITVDVNLLQTMEAIDRQIKNSRLGDPWLALERFLLKYA